MTDDVEVVTLPAFVYAYVRVSVPRDEIGTAMPAAIADLHRGLAARGIAPTGPLFAHHLELGPERFELDAGLEVPRRGEDDERVRFAEAPAIRVARTRHQGPYEGLPEAWAAFERRTDLRGLVATDDLWERYVAGPGETDDETRYVTELVQPLA